MEEKQDDKEVSMSYTRDLIGGVVTGSNNIFGKNIKIEANHLHINNLPKELLPALFGNTANKNANQKDINESINIAKQIQDILTIVEELKKQKGIQTDTIITEGSTVSVNDLESKEDDLEKVILYDVERYANVNGLLSRYVELGRHNSSNHILFIHDLGSTADLWIRTLIRLAENFHLIALDIIGFGKSDKSMTINYSPKNLAGFVQDFMHEIGIDDGNTTIVGHSLGGLIALEVALGDKSLVKELVLINSYGMLTKPTPLLNKYLDAALNPSYNKVKGVLEQIYPNRLDLRVYYFIQSMSSSIAKHSFSSTFENSTKNKIEPERLKLIANVPTLIIWGLEEKLIPLEHSLLFLKALESSEFRLLRNTGHLPFVERPAIISEIISAFVTEKATIQPSTR